MLSFGITSSANANFKARRAYFVCPCRLCSNVVAEFPISNTQIKCINVVVQKPNWIRRSYLGYYHIQCFVWCLICAIFVKWFKNSPRDREHSHMLVHITHRETNTFHSSGWLPIFICAALFGGTLSTYYYWKCFVLLLFSLFLSLLFGRLKSENLVFAGIIKWKRDKQHETLNATTSE